jgi:dTDP-4-dehydrorhamnose reductase
MKVIVTGADGQLGRELQLTAPVGVDCLPLNRVELDIGDLPAVSRRLDLEQPGVLINAAAYTAVDRAESEPAAAARVNAEGAANLATACDQTGCRLLHVSTDFVFDGQRGQPYPPSAATAPLGEYGRTKLLGEEAVVRLAPGSLILRTGWVYSRFGGNFVTTMLRLMAEREELTVVCDQVGTPTWARGLAEALWACALRPAVTGIYHWSDAGVCSWYDFAVAISEEAVALGVLEQAARVRPIPAADYPTPARRPAYSVLDKSDSWRDLAMNPVHWRVQLRAMLSDLKGAKS